MWGWALVLVVGVLGAVLLQRAGHDNDEKNARIRERIEADRARIQANNQQPGFVVLQQPAPAQEVSRAAVQDDTARVAAPPTPQSVAPPPPLGYSLLEVRPAAELREGIGSSGRDAFKHDEYVPEEKTETYWRRRLSASKIRLRDAFEMLRAQACTGGISDVGQSSYAHARGVYEGARMTQASLEEEARRAAVPAGWVRLDWSEYPMIDEILRNCVSNR
jgi:hypothetical protein